ncbi:MAG: murein L,D-transpeptidase catalytic domain family protein [Chitinophagaceae bacterium]|nr:murein L,D-transpeptidase catalytic domain family protein [Chitinophagaceae bacterium]
MRKFVFTFVLLTAFLLITGATWYFSRFHSSGTNAGKVTVSAADSTAIKKLTGFSSSLSAFAATKKYNTRTGFLIDMSLSSGENRFFIMDLEKDSVVNAGLVTHGRCNENWLNGRKYSNETGSGCTSLGRYRIGASYQGRFGLAYKLHGLDSTNSNAFRRYVVLHSHDCVPDNETHPLLICQSDGCPTVSPSFLKKLQQIINASEKPVVLWIHE